jgi:hypothetical protein
MSSIKGLLDTSEGLLEVNCIEFAVHETAGFAEYKICRGFDEHDLNKVCRIAYVCITLNFRGLLYFKFNGKGLAE